MPGQGTPIIIGGGIDLASPNAIGEFAYLTSITPPAAATTRRWRLSGDSLIAETAAGRGDTSIGPGTNGNIGAGNNRDILIGNSVVVNHGSSVNQANVILSNGVTVSGVNNVILGDGGLGAGFAGSRCVIIGRPSGSSLSNDGVCIGDGASFSSGLSSAVTIGASANGSNGSVVIGASTVSSSGNNVVIGNQAGASGARSICIGNQARGTGTTQDVILLGANISAANLSGIIAIGGGVSLSGLAAGDIVIGHNNNGGGGFSSRVVWGGANLHTNATAVPPWTNRWKNAQGTDVAAGDVTFIAPRATGSATGGAFVFQTAPAGASSAVLQTPQSVFRIEPSSNIAFTGAGGAPSYGSGVGVFFLANAGTNPSTNPVGGGILYVNAGALTYRGPAGTVSVIAPA